MKDNPLNDGLIYLQSQRTSMLENIARWTVYALALWKLTEIIYWLSTHVRIV
jgi:hypothetical protein